MEATAFSAWRRGKALFGPHFSRSAEAQLLPLLLAFDKETVLRHHVEAGIEAVLRKCCSMFAFATRTEQAILHGLRLLVTGDDLGHTRDPGR